MDRQVGGRDIQTDGQKDWRIVRMADKELNGKKEERQII